MIQQPLARRLAGARPVLVALVALVALVPFALGGCGRSAGDTPADEAPPAAGSPAAAPAGGGPGASSESAAEGALSASAAEMLAWLPEDDTIPGWTRSTAPRHFGPASLWEHINGAAESYLAFDFQELLTLDFTHAAHGLRVTIDLYRMASPLGAFGIYAQETNPAAEFLSVGAEGQLNGTAVTLWSGSSYAKLTSGDRHAELAPGLRALAAEIGRRIGGETKRPAQFDRFPAVGLSAHSFKVVPKDALGQSYLADAFEAEYGSGDAAWKLTLVPFDSADAAVAAFARYREFIAASGAAPKDLTSPGQGAFAGRDSFYGIVVAARSGSAIGVALGPPTERAGVDAVTHLLK